MITVAAAALIDREGRVLVQRRPPGGALGDLWEFPGGKLEPHETPASALVRELREELAIVVDEGDLAPFAFASEPLGQRHLLLLLYLCRVWAGSPTLNYATAFQWLRPAELESLAMPPADRPLVARLVEASTSIAARER